MTNRKENIKNIDFKIDCYINGECYLTYVNQMNNKNFIIFKSNQTNN